MSGKRRGKYVWNLWVKLAENIYFKLCKEFSEKYTKHCELICYPSLLYGSQGGKLYVALIQLYVALIKYGWIIFEEVMAL